MAESKPKSRPRQAAPKKAARAKTPSVDREAQVRIAAYLRAEKRGFAPGYETADWLAAEAEIAAREQGRPAAKPRKTAARKPSSA